MKVSRNKRLAALGIGVVATAGIVAGCASPQLDDLRNISVQYPNYAVTWMNVSQFPNITEVCINGVAFATTTRDYTSVIRIPEWDAFCRTQEGKQATVNGQP